MPVQFQKPLFNCDYVKDKSILESKGTEKVKKDYVNKANVSCYYGNFNTKTLKNVYVLFLLICLSRAG